MKSTHNNHNSPKKKLLGKFSRIFKSLGPGLVTGASDDDPSGIATYSQAGAQFGLATLWTAFITYPLMTSIQEMCARIGMVTDAGLTTTLKKHYPKVILYIMLLFSFPAIVMNIGADIEGMGAVANLIFPKIPVFVFSILFTVVMTFVIIKYSYPKLAQILKWLCIVLLLYLVVPFLTATNWSEVLQDAFIPEIHFNKEFIGILVAILGTTISPYLFYWQATMEAEDFDHDPKKIVVNRRMLRNMQVDVNIGMLFSNLVMFFIILTAGTVLHTHGVTKIDTVDQAAAALKPLAGNLAYAIFAIGIFGTGLLALPVLAGSMSYMFAETFGWKMGLDKKFGQAKEFYIIIIISLVLGLILNFVGISPIKGLIYTAVLYGLTAPVLIAIILHISNNKKIMKSYTNNKLSNITGFITLALMTAAAIALLYLQFN
jgi:NRAMP (natural resistance-associated macrophage protein)-like metal ion transporter